MKRIPLPNDRAALVDDEDYARLSGYNWQFTGEGKAGPFRWIGGRKERRGVWMSREILDLPDSDARRVTYLNRNPLDNRRENLYVTSAGAVQQRTPKPKIVPGSRWSSQYVGVVRSSAKHSVRWIARIKVRGERLHIGTFDSETDAAAAYDEAATRFYGENARINFPSS